MEKSGAGHLGLGMDHNVYDLKEGKLPGTGCPLPSREVDFLNYAITWGRSGHRPDLVASASQSWTWERLRG